MTNDEAKDMAALAIHLDRQAKHYSEHLPRTTEAGAAVALRLVKHSKTLSKLAVYACNGDMLPGMEEREARTVKAVDSILSAYGVNVEHGGDPRGHVVKLHFTYAGDDAKPYNTWGGAESGWGIG